MIRILLFLFLFLTLILPLAQAEILTRAYYLGKEQLSDWKDREEQILNAKSSDKRDISLHDPSPLKNAPFKSPHFHPGDALYDFKTFQEFLASSQGKLDHLIYNQTTGYLIVQGEQISHHLFKFIAVSTTEHQPKTIELQLELREANIPLLTTTLQANPGQKVLLETGSDPNHLKIEWEAYHGTLDPYVEARFTLNGTVRDQKFELITGVTAIAGIPINIELGASATAQAPLSLLLKHRVLLPGGISTDEVVLDENGRTISSPWNRPMDSILFEKALPDPKTGQILRGFRVPPTFITFMTTSVGNAPTGDDPFAAEAPAPTDPQGIIYLKQWDPRIPATPSDRIADCKQLLQNSGVQLSDSDFAVLNLETNSLFVLGSQLELELVDGITNAHCTLPPALIEANFQLIETADKPTLDSIKNKPTLLAQATTIVLPGQSSTLTLGPMHLDLDPQIGANDSLVEARYFFQLAEGEKEPSFYLKSGLTLETGIPQIVQSTFADGKWQSLVVTTTIQSPWERASSTELGLQSE